MCSILVSFVQHYPYILGYKTYGAGFRPCLGEGTDLIGKQIKNLGTCKLACSNFESCNGFAWNFKDNRCYIKRGIHFCSDKAGCAWERSDGKDSDWHWFYVCPGKIS